MPNIHKQGIRRKGTKNPLQSLEVILLNRLGSPKVLSTIKMGTSSRHRAILPHDLLNNPCSRMLVINLASLTKGRKIPKLDQRLVSNKVRHKLSSQYHLLKANLKSARRVPMKEDSRRCRASSNSQNYPNSCKVAQG